MAKNKEKKEVKEVKEEKNIKSKTKKVEKKDVKKKKKTKKENYLKGVKKELKLVKWPAFKEVMKYTIATIVFCIVLCGFFILLNLLMSWVKGMFI